MKNPI